MCALPYRHFGTNIKILSIGNWDSIPLFNWLVCSFAIIAIVLHNVNNVTNVERLIELTEMHVSKQCSVQENSGGFEIG